MYHIELIFGGEAANCGRGARYYRAVIGGVPITDGWADASAARRMADYAIASGGPPDDPNLPNWQNRERARRRAAIAAAAAPLHP